MAAQRVGETAIDRDRDRDLSKRDDLSRIEAILRSNAAITTLVNNAGVGATAPLLNLTSTR